MPFKLSTVKSLDPDSLVGCALVLVGTAAMFFSHQMGLGNASNVGPGLVPFGTGGVLAAGGLLFVVPRVRGFGTRAGTADRVSRDAWARFLKVLLALTSWPLLVGMLGYVCTSCLVSLTISKSLGYEGWLKPILLSASVALFVWLIFGVLFYVDLPPGLWQLGS